MRRLKFGKTVLFLVPFLAALLATTSLTRGVAHAVEFEPCFRDLSLNKQVKVPGGDFVDAHDSSSAPQATVGNTVEWKITVTNVTHGGCETFDLPGTIVVHDVMPAGFNFVSSSGTPTYDSSTNDWSFPAGTVVSPGGAQLILDTTATQVGTFENVATMTSLITCVQIENEIECTTHNYAIDSVDDPLYAVKDKNSENDSSNAWVSISAKPVVLAASTGDPQVLALVNTGSGTVESIIAGLFIATTFGVLVYSRGSRAKQTL